MRHGLLLAISLLAMACGPRSSAAPEPPPSAPSRAPAPQRAGDAATFKLVNDGGGAAESVVSFGQIFTSGSVQPNAKLVIKLNGSPVAAQMNPKALYPDGSVRHAVVAVRAPAMSRNASLNGLISTTGETERPAAPAAASAPPPDLGVTLTFAAGPSQGKTYRFDLPTLAKAPANRRDPPWLNGPLVQEQRYYASAVEGVQLVFDVWTPVTGPPRVDVIVHNDTAQNADIETETYAVTMTLAGKPVFHADEVEHYPHSTWHKVIQAGGADLRIEPDAALLAAAGATPRYAKVRPAPGTIEKLHDAAETDGTPLDTAGVTTRMGTTGGRADIGPLPTWAVVYLMSPTRKNRETLFANADAAGSIPWHARDERTQGPINIDKYPKLWLDGRGQATPGILGRRFMVSDTKWEVDRAHAPSLTYLPYLLTGSQYYLDELAQQAGHVLVSTNPDYRRDAQGLIVVRSQIRGVAWDLRTLANAAYILPTSDPLQGYFQAKLEGNLKEVIRRYVDGHDADGAGELEGFLPGEYGVVGAIPPWQNDYLVIVLGWMDDMGFHDARPIMGWMTNFVAGRFTNGDKGYDPIYGTPYFLRVRHKDPDEPIDTWAAVFHETFEDEEPVTALDYPEGGGGYAALARASLATIMRAAPSPRAKQAYDYVVKHSPNMNYAEDPTFAIAPPPRPEAASPTAKSSAKNLSAARR